MTTVKNIAPILQETLKSVEGSIVDECERTLHLVSAHPDIAEILKETLWADSNILCHVFGWIHQDESGWGNHATWGDSPLVILDRIGFANHFAGYQILDDGDPGIAYCRHYCTSFGDPPHLHGRRVCSKNHDMAKPFITAYREGFCELEDWSNSSCNEERVLAVFRYYEQDALRRLHDCMEYAKELAEEDIVSGDREMKSIAESIQNLVAEKTADSAAKIIRQWMIDNDIVPASKRHLTSDNA